MKTNKRCTKFIVMSDSNVNVDNECPICMDKLEETNISVTKCGHSFCLQCIIKHSKSGDNRCPLCRANITEDEPQVPNNQDQDDVDYRLMDAALRRRLINISSFIAPRHEYENIVRLSSRIDQYDANRYNIDIDIYAERLIHPIRTRQNIQPPPPPTPPPPPLHRDPPPPPQQRGGNVQVHHIQRAPVTRRCGICKQTGHNRRTCPTRPPNNQHLITVQLGQVQLLNQPI